MELDQILNAFRDWSSRAPEIAAIAPGRVNLIGEHIDYNDGLVLPMAINRNIRIAGARSNLDRRFATVHSLCFNQTIKIPLDPNAAVLDGWGRYLQGVVLKFQAQGISVPAFDAVVSSDIPQGGGLSSSAALEVAMATFPGGSYGPFHTTPRESNFVPGSGA